MAFSAKSLRLLSSLHLLLGILAMAAGIASMSVTDYYSGLFGMGIWLGSWVLLTGLAGVASSLKPGNFCRIGIFLGCSLVAIVILSICSIIIGTVVIRYFHFESTVTRDYYKGKGTFGQKNHDDYYKPEEYFEDRRNGGMIGLAVYGCLLAVNICDILLCSVSVYVCRDLTRNEQAPNRESRSRGASQGNAVAVVPDAQVGYGGQNWAELVFQEMPQPMPLHFIQNPDYQFFTAHKLPNYAELYPEGIVNSSIVNEQHVHDEPPPEYTPSADPSLYSMLPGSPVEAPLNSLHTSIEENSTVEDSETSARTFTAQSASVLETTGVSQHSSVHDTSTMIPNTLAINTESAMSALSCSSLNASEDLNNTVCFESQNNTDTDLENGITEANGSETR